MSGFCGWVGFEAHGQVQRTVLERMVGALVSGGGRPGSSRIEGTAAVALDSSQGGTWIAKGADHICVVAGSPYFDDADLSRVAEERGAAAALLHGFLAHGPRTLDLVRGAFATAILGTRSPEALLAVDRIGGRRPLRYKVDGQCLIFGTNGRAIQAHPVGRSAVDMQGIYNYIHFHVVPGPGTARQGVSRLMPGTYLRFSEGKVRVESYWEAVYREHEPTSLVDLEVEFRQLLRNAVRRSVSDGQVGCFLSGGTDSSTIAGLIGEVSGRAAKTYSIGFDAEGYDEMKYAREAASYFGTEHHEYYLKPQDVVELIPRIAEAHSDPFGNESVVPTYHCARIAREDGVGRMLAGDGGDELFAGNTRYAKQEVFQAYQRLPSALRTGVLEPLIFGVPAGYRFPPIRKVQNYIRQSNIPMPKRTQTYNYLVRLGATEMMEPDFLSAVDRGQPLDLLSETYHGAKAESMLNRLLAMSLRFTLADNDLPKVSRMCQLAGVSVEYPLLSDELVEFSCRLPVRLKMRRLKLRWFFKRALRDFLPEKILAKKKHGFGMPFGVWLQDHQPLREIVLDSLQSLKSRRIVRAEFIDRLLQLHGQNHAVYFGVLIWVFVQLEQWFKTQVDAVSRED